MKKLLFLIVSGLTAVTAQADEKSTAVLSALQREVEGWGAYRVEFSVSADGAVTKGEYEVSGESYRVGTPDIQLVSDGITRWEVDRNEKTVMIDTVDPTDRSVLSNPTRLFDFLDGGYTHRFVGAALVGGVQCDRLELKDVKTGDRVEAYISMAGRPVRLVYSLPGLDSEAVLDVVQITPRAALSGDFRPDLPPDYEVIDFR